MTGKKDEIFKLLKSLKFQVKFTLLNKSSSLKGQVDLTFEL